MLKVRVIPTLLCKTFGLVKGVAFDSWRRLGPVLPAVRVYNRRDVDELMLFNILAQSLEDSLDYDVIEELSAECFVPLTVGGGVRNVEQATMLLRFGADKISINSAAYDQPELVNKIAQTHGSQSVVASIDARLSDNGTQWTCFSHSGSRPTGLDPVYWAAELEKRGAGEILLTSIDRDGTMQGYDLNLVSAVSGAVSIPVIASGGAGSYLHMVQAVKQAGAAAVAASSMFQFTEQTPHEAKKYMSAAGINVRT
jgi:cyclase